MYHSSLSPGSSSCCQKRQDNEKKCHNNCAQVGFSNIPPSDSLMLILNVSLLTLYRLSTIQAADRIVVMDSGRIVEVSTWAILCKYCPS